MCIRDSSLGYDLTYVRNITDVDDKIIKRALENKETCDQLVDRMAVSYTHLKAV